MTLDADQLAAFRERIRARAASALSQPGRADRLAAFLTAVALRQAREARNAPKPPEDAGQPKP